MVANLPAIGAPFVFEAAELAQLFPSLQRRGYQVVGPAVRGSAIVYDILNSFEELPAGWTAEPEAGSYRLKRRDDRRYKPFIEFLIDPPAEQRGRRDVPTGGVGLQIHRLMPHVQA